MVRSEPLPVILGSSIVRPASVLSGTRGVDDDGSNGVHVPPVGSPRAGGLLASSVLYAAGGRHPWWPGPSSPRAMSVEGDDSPLPPATVWPASLTLMIPY